MSRSSCRKFGTGKDREENRRQDRDNRDHDKKFNKREAGAFLQHYCTYYSLSQENCNSICRTLSLAQKIGQSEPVKERVDVTIIGGGPVGLFGGVLCRNAWNERPHHRLLPELSGQLMALYPEKFVYDMPGFPKC
ncbi:MAG: hypothetical protein R2688_04775 [Fimbriimonadaceae bacterium]